MGSEKSLKWEEFKTCPTDIFCKKMGIDDWFNDLVFEEGFTWGFER